MNCLLVVAHPLTDSLCRHLAGLAGRELAAAGHSVTVLDLYAMDFDPRLTQAERLSYYAVAHDDSAVLEHAAALRSAEMLVLVFPTWWFGMPAILKGWIDRVFAPGVAFAHGDDFGPIRPLLGNLRRLAAITTLGSPWWADWLVLWRPLPRILRRAVAGACAPRARVDFFSLYSAEKLSADRLRRFEKRMSKALRRS